MFFFFAARGPANCPFNWNFPTGPFHPGSSSPLSSDFFFSPNAPYNGHYLRLDLATSEWRIFSFTSPSCIILKFYCPNWNWTKLVHPFIASFCLRHIHWLEIFYWVIFKIFKEDSFFFLLLASRFFKGKLKISWSPNVRTWKPQNEQREKKSKIKWLKIGYKKSTSRRMKQKTRSIKSSCEPEPNKEAPEPSPNPNLEKRNHTSRV